VFREVRDLRPVGREGQIDPHGFRLCGKPETNRPTAFGVDDVQALAAEKTRRRVAQAVGGEPRTFDEVREEIEPDEDGRRPSVRTVRDVLNALVDSGEAVREGIGKKGDAYRWKSA